MCQRSCSICTKDREIQITHRLTSQYFGELHDSQSREAIKYGRDFVGLEPKNDCTGENQQIFTKQRDQSLVPSRILKNYIKENYYKNCLKQFKLQWTHISHRGSVPGDASVYQIGVNERRITTYFNWMCSTKRKIEILFHEVMQNINCVPGQHSGSS
jgi:hypothetical protein